MRDMSQKKCKPCEGGAKPLSRTEIHENLKTVRGWSLEETEIVKTFKFNNYYETLAFVNAVAGVARQENHHPMIEFGYKTCEVRYMTHAINGLSENDFICAAKVDGLPEARSA